MKRRAFIAAGGITLGAGCSGLMDDSKGEKSKPPAECAIDPDVTPGTPGWPSVSGGPRNTRSVPSVGVPTPPLKLDWTFRTGEHMAAPEPVVANGTVYATNYDDDVHAVDAETGEHRWWVTVPVDSRVAVAGNRLFVVSDESLRALDTKDGETVWTTELAAEPGIFSTEIQVTEDTVFVYGGLFLSAFDVKTGKRRWKFSTGLETEGCPAIADGVVYVGSDDTYVYALEAATGERQWRYKTDDSVSCDTPVADGVVYAGSEASKPSPWTAGTFTWVADGVTPRHCRRLRRKRGPNAGRRTRATLDTWTPSPRVRTGSTFQPGLSATETRSAC